MSNMKPDHNDDDGLIKEYTKNKENIWTDSYLKDCLGFQLGVWWFQTASKSKVNWKWNETWRSLCRHMKTDKHIQGLTLSLITQAHL